MDSELKKSLTILSALQELEAGGVDILDAMVPILEPIFPRKAGSLFDPNELAAAAETAYGWTIEGSVIALLLPRFVDRGWVREVSRGHFEVADVPPIRQLNETVTRRLEEASEQMETFAKRVLPLASKGYKRSDYAEMLVNWLTHLGYEEADILSSNDTVVDMDGLLVVDNPTARAHREDHYLAARFINHLNKSNSDLIPYLSEIAAVGMLVDVIADLRKPPSASKNCKLSVLLDSPIALEALGLSGANAEKNFSSILLRGAEIGIQFQILESSIVEIKNSLKALLSRDATERRGPTADALRRGEADINFAKEVSRNPSRYLQGIGVATVPDPKVNSGPHQDIFHQQDYEEFFSLVTWHENTLPREHDAIAVLKVMRARGGYQTDDLFEAKSVFLTHNQKFAYTAKRFAVDSNFSSSEHVSPVIDRRMFAASLWLRAGAGLSSPDLPKREMLAAGERILELNPNVIRTAKRKIAESSPEKIKQLELLLETDRNVMLLQDRFTDYSITQSEPSLTTLVEELKQNLVLEEKAKFDELISQYKKNSAKRGRDRSKIVADQKEEIAGLKSATISLSESKGRLLEGELRALNSVADLATKKYRLAFRLSFAVAFILVLFLVTGAALSTMMAGPLGFIISIVFAIFIGILTFSSLLGKKFNPRHVAKGIADKHFRNIVSKRSLQFESSRHQLVEEEGVYRVMLTGTETHSRDV